jgi:uncharacterized protein YceK
MRNLALALLVVAALAGCTTTERDIAAGTAIGATTGAAVGGTTEAAATGAAIGAAGGLLVRNMRNGYCEYRNPRTGQIYTARC